MTLTDKIFRFKADSYHNDQFGGDPDLSFIAQANFHSIDIIKGIPLDNVDFVFKKKRSKLIESGMLTVDAGYSIIPVCSKEMLQVIEMYGPSQLLSYPAKIEGEIRQSYFVLQIPLLDIFDWIKSEYNHDDVIAYENLKLVGDVSEYVFTESYDQLPPIFRISAQPHPMFMRIDVREELKIQGIGGISFTNLGKLSKSNQFVTDIPV